ncbi:Hypothetical protein A7982_05109 [Minicystis rosea]|nr:Hypothetical protein A7982_05109 [Minicystis rosea]
MQKVIPSLALGRPVHGHDVGPTTGEGLIHPGRSARPRRGPGPIPLRRARRHRSSAAPKP